MKLLGIRAGQLLRPGLGPCFPHERLRCIPWNSFHKFVATLNYHTSRKDQSHQHVPVTIVGGGPVGLFLSNLLSSFQVPSVLVESKPLESCFLHPQAHFLNTRTMEILRTNLPAAYQRVLSAMPHSDEYKNFCFGYNLREKYPLATVVHPVHHPLQMEQDANGKLLESVHDHGNEELVQRHALSPCTVGHLAQHKFARILFEESLDAAGGSYGDLKFGVRVERITQEKVESDLPGRRLWMNTSCGQSWSTDICVAADGASSTLRQAERLGNYKEQFLINVHVKLRTDQSELIPNDFMLYTALNEHVVAMIVSHGDGEYVLQIPYFPPYQEPDVDFAPHKVLRMLKAVFGFPISSEQVLSVRPWTMTSWVASRYHNRQGLVWVGDAAHAFPPAGGFGMNTGVQDAHNLAWKIFALLKDQGENDNEFMRQRNYWLDSYERERRPVAVENAALSVRNYDRVLAVMNECYLNHKHPQFAKDSLDMMKSFVALAPRQEIFRSLLKTALQPLAWLDSSSSPSLYRKHVQSNLRRLLKHGGGLPLLFPKFEVGFCYQDKDQTTNSPITSSTKDPHISDTFADTILQEIQVGCRLPHAAITPHISKSCGSKVPDWSTIDLTTRLTVSRETSNNVASELFQPSWVLLVFDSNMAGEQIEFWEGIRQNLEHTSRLSTQTVYLNNHSTYSDVEDNEQTQRYPNHHAFVFNTRENALVGVNGVALVRPDGHVAAYFQDMDGVQENLLAALR